VDKIVPQLFMILDTRKQLSENRNGQSRKSFFSKVKFSCKSLFSVTPFDGILLIVTIFSKKDGEYV
jgi:hypothetical protein